ncbi:hypothetical protein GGF43_002869 [Coemansia sp. RSA 2618]|nr:hypothetical protein GGF43_002869 [Coemansia sp. RSA 2618]
MPKECRAVVMDLNMNRGQAEAAKKQRTSMIHDLSIQPAALSATPSLANRRLDTGGHEPSPPSKSKWDDYAESAERADEPPDEAGHELDKHNRIVIGQVERDKPAARRTAKRAAPKPKKYSRQGASANAPSTSIVAPGPAVVSRPAGRSAFSQALAAMSQPQTAVPRQQTSESQARVAAVPRKRGLESIQASAGDTAEQQGPSRWECYASDSGSESD